MVDPLEALPVKVQAIEDKLDARFNQIDARFDRVDARFDRLMSALAEHRQHTEFAFDRFREEMMSGFSSMTDHFGRLERKLDQVIDRLTRPRSDP